jgi:hypothetical protein
MSFKITITEEEILNHPNDFELGKLVRMKYINQTNQQEKLKYDENYFTPVQELCPICGTENRCGDEKICEKDL